MPKVSKKRSASAISNATGNSSRRHHTDKPYASSSNTAVSNNNNNLMSPNTRLGQHFLKNPAVITHMLQKAGIHTTDTILEIGPGTGNLTMPLLQQASRVVALEYDPRCCREVIKRVEQTPHAHKLQVIQGDALKTVWPTHFDLLIANLPYQISSPVLFKLLSLPTKFRAALLLLQEEFALRLTARPGEALYGRLSVNTQLLATVDQLLKVGKENFRPPPKVESRVVRIVLKNPRPPVNFVEWDGMIRLLFNRKNKTLRAVLNTKAVFKLLEQNRQTVLALNNKHDNNADQHHHDNNDRSVQEIVLDIVDREPWKGQRASKMDLDDFLQLLTEFNEAGIHFG